MRIPFDISKKPQIESGEYKVETGDGRSVRIISWDKKVFGGRTEIVALVSTPKGDTETVQLYCPDGKLIVASWDEKFKLFIVTPEPEMTEFEKAIEAIYESCGVKELQVKKKASELLALAREELFANDTVLKEYAEEARKQGKDEALKDLPRWEKQMYATQEVNIYLPTNEFVYRGMAISIDELTKLPGFKEDESHE